MAHDRLGIVARTNINDQTKRSSRSSAFAAWPAVAMPSPIPTPKAETTSPHPDGPASSVSLTNTGPIARTAPTAANAPTIPPVIADASEFSRRKLMPSSVSCHTRETSMCPVA